MISNIARKADSYLAVGIELLKKLISYKSVMGDPCEGAPYGKACADVLNFAEHTLQEEGFITRNVENHAVTAALDDRPPEVGVLAHLDVVPTEGQAWSSDPFIAEIRDDRIYGRGAIDDKGPAAAIITAMKILRDSAKKGEITLKRNMRLILGSNEENGSEDMAYYTKREAFPPMLFTPDGSFPVITMEKGMVRYDMTRRIAGQGEKAVTRIDCTGPYNAVPELACAEVRGIQTEEVLREAERVSTDGICFSVTELPDNCLRINAHGKAAHASTPEKGRNALTALCTLLARLHLDGDAAAAVSLLSEKFPYGENDGTHAGLKYSDSRMGDATIVMSRMSFDGEILQAGFDCRFPSAVDKSDIIGAFSKAAETCGMEGTAVAASDSHSADPDSELVRTLLSVYEDFTGKKGKCIAIGGGTYVHDTKNGVAFGAEWSDENNMHSADEFIGIDEFRNDIIIYTEALLRLLTNESEG